MQGCREEGGNSKMEGKLATKTRVPVRKNSVYVSNGCVVKLNMSKALHVLMLSIS